MLKAILFDVDDTLLDWSAADVDWYTYDRDNLRRVFAYAREELGHPLRDFRTFAAETRARGVDAWEAAASDLNAPHLGRVLVETLAVLGVPHDRLDIDACLRVYGWQGFPNVTLYPEVLEALARLRGHGLRLGVVTNAYQPMWMRDVELASLGLTPDLFDCRLSSADVGYLKPHPAIFQRALDCLGVQASEAVFVGDAPQADILGAQGVGMRAILRLGSEITAALRDTVTPDATLYGLDELPAILSAWYPGWQDGDTGY